MNKTNMRTRNSKTEGSSFYYNSLCDYSLFTLCEIDVVSFHLIETNGFYITTEKKRLIAAEGGGWGAGGLVVVRTSNFKI